MVLSHFCLPVAKHRGAHSGLGCAMLFRITVRGTEMGGVYSRLTQIKVLGTKMTCVVQLLTFHQGGSVWFLSLPC